MTIGAAARGLLLLALAAIAVAIGAARASGQTLLVVTGGSMEPSIHKGAVVLVQPVAPADLRPGDVTTFALRGEVVTHRVVAVDATPEGLAFTTKGDANTVADPEAKVFAERAGRVRLTVPLVGYAALALQAYGRILLAVLAAASLLAGVGAMRREARASRATAVELERLRLYCTVRSRGSGRAA